jgi:hypothetical protein
MPYKRAAATRDVVLIVAAVVLMAAAIGLYFSLRKPEGAPTDQFVDFYCPDCDHHFQLSHRDVEQTIWERRDFEQDEIGKMRIRCPKCSRYTARRATGIIGQPKPDSADPD